MKKENLIKILEYYQNAVAWTNKCDFGIKFNELKIEITFKETSIFFDSYACEDTYTYVFKLNDENLDAILFGLKHSNYEVLGYSILSISCNDKIYYIQSKNKEIKLDVFIFVVSVTISNFMSFDLLDNTNCVFTVVSERTSFCVLNDFLPYLMMDLFKYYDAKKFNRGVFKFDLSYTKQD